MNLLLIICNCCSFCQNTVKMHLAEKANFIWDNQNVNICKSNQRVKCSKILCKSLNDFYWIPCYTLQESTWEISVYNLWLQGKNANEAKGQQIHPWEIIIGWKTVFLKKYIICEEPAACVSEDVEVNWRCVFLKSKKR